MVGRITAWLRLVRQQVNVCQAPISQQALQATPNQLISNRVKQVQQEAAHSTSPNTHPLVTCQLSKGSRSSTPSSSPIPSTITSCQEGGLLVGCLGLGPLSSPPPHPPCHPTTPSPASLIPTHPLLSPLSQGLLAQRLTMRID